MPLAATGPGSASHRFTLRRVKDGESITPLPNAALTSARYIRSAKFFGLSSPSRARHSCAAASGDRVSPVQSSAARRSGEGCASCSICSAGISRCSTSVKSLPNGNDGSSPASRAGFSAAAIRSGVLSRTSLRGFRKLFASLPASLAARASSSWKRESDIPSIAAITSASDLPLTSATPYSVMKTSRRCRGMVSWP